MGQGRGRGHIYSHLSTKQRIGRAAKAFSGHETVTHRDHEYAAGEVHSNTAENLASVLKRAQLGVFHFLSQRHLQRYIDEIIFRMNQREIKRRAYRKGGRVSLELSYLSFEEQLKNLLKRAVGRQIRRSRKGGKDWPPPIARGSAPRHRRLDVTSHTISY
ncbi:transposase [Rhizobium azibense]|uniref:transposase n=1 Tax=Rhizobium azibense TaxID=1136135 RepID=UPI003CCB39DF